MDSSPWSDSYFGQSYASRSPFGESLLLVLLQCRICGSPITFLPDNSFFVDVYALFGIDWVMPGSVVDLLFCWCHCLGKYSFDIWDLVPGCLMWTIWIERKWWSFEDEGKTMIQLLEICQRTPFDWPRCWDFSDCSTLLDFISSIRID